MPLLEIWGTPRSLPEGQREISRSPAPSQNEHFSLQFRPRFVPHIKEEPCTQCLHHGNSSGTLVGLRKVPAARSDNAVGSAEREERKVTARESRSPITRKLSVPERRGGGGAPGLLSPTLVPSFQRREEKPGWCRRPVPQGWRCCWSQPGCCGTQRGNAAEPTRGRGLGRGRDGDSRAKAGLTPAGPFLGDIWALLLPLCNAVGSEAALREEGTSLQPGSPRCSQKPTFGAQSTGESPGRAAAGHHAACGAWAGLALPQQSRSEPADIHLLHSHVLHCTKSGSSVLLPKRLSLP